MVGFVSVPGGSRIRGHRARTCAPMAESSALAEFLSDTARVSVPLHLSTLLDVLEARGQKLVAPSDRAGYHPFFIPMSTNPDGGSSLGFLRWPTPPPEMNLPIVSTSPGGRDLRLEATSPEAFIRRYVAERNSVGGNIDFPVPEQFKLEDGAVESIGLGLERYLVLKVGPFPDVYEGLARFHELKGDHQSALVCAERAGVAFPGWARGHCFHSRLLDRIKRKSEARDAARYALQLPLWTLGDSLDEIGDLAGYQDRSSLEKIFKRLAEDPREDEITGGKAPEQVALDRAAYLMDYTYAAKGEWDSIKSELAGLYEDGKAVDVAQFIRSS